MQSSSVVHPRARRLGDPAKLLVGHGRRRVEVGLEIVGSRARRRVDADDVRRLRGERQDLAPPAPDQDRDLRPWTGIGKPAISLHRIMLRPRAHTASPTRSRAGSRSPRGAARSASTRGRSRAPSPRTRPSSSRCRCRARLAHRKSSRGSRSPSRGRPDAGNRWRARSSRSAGARSRRRARLRRSAGRAADGSDDPRRGSSNNRAPRRVAPAQRATRRRRRRGI
jgi:hypothetical protein